MKLRPLHGEENRSLTEQLDVFLTSKTCFCADDDGSSGTDQVTSRWAGTFKSLTSGRELVGSRPQTHTQKTTNGAHLHLFCSSSRHSTDVSSLLYIFSSVCRMYSFVSVFFLFVLLLSCFDVFGATVCVFDVPLFKICEYLNSFILWT